LEQQIVQQVGIGLLALMVGISGWVLPYKWNPLKFKSIFSPFFSEKINKAIPKVLGTILTAGGMAILIATAIIGKFK